MNDVKVFQFDAKDVRTVNIDGESFWVGKDVCEILGYKDPTTALKSYCKGVQKQHPLMTAGGIQKLRIIGEPDLYRLIIGSKLPTAERFEKWVMEEVLPALRKTGSFNSEKKDSPIDNLPNGTQLREMRLGMPKQDFRDAVFHIIGLEIKPYQHPNSTLPKKEETANSKQAELGFTEIKAFLNGKKKPN